MDWNALKTFLAVARHGTLTGASRELGVNHSTVFRRLNSFEDSIGSRLFERLNDGYHLTEAGEVLFSQGENIADAFDTLERYITARDYKPSGTIRLTAPESFAYRYLPNHLASFQKLYPQIKLELNVSSETINLTKREADIALRATNQPPEHLVGRRLFRLPWAIYAASNNKGAMPKSMEDLMQFELIGAEGHLSQLAPFRWLDKHYQQQQTVRSNKLCAMAALAKTGLGLAILPDDQQQSGLKRLFETPYSWNSEIWLLTHPDLRQVERIRLLMQHLYDGLSKDHRLHADEVP